MNGKEASASESEVLGTLADGREAHTFCLRALSAPRAPRTGGKQRTGIEACVTDYGARLVSLRVPDRTGALRDVVLGADTLAAYVADEYCLGAIIGRNANRIEGARFALSGREYRLAANEGANNLHSGPDGFEHRLWELRREDLARNRVTFHLSSAAGDQGFPGNLDLRVTYELVGSDELRLTFRGRASEETVLNPTTHTYFNLDGVDAPSSSAVPPAPAAPGARATPGPLTIENHLLQIHAEKYAYVTSSDYIPRGEAPVVGTAMDFRTPTTLHEALQKGGDQLAVGRGFNHAFLVAGASAVTASDVAPLVPVAEVYSPESGIRMQVSGDSASVLLYTADYLEGFPGKYQRRYGPRAGLCLEPGFVPNAINDVTTSAKPILAPGAEFVRQIRYRFSGVASENRGA